MAAAGAPLAQRQPRLLRLTPTAAGTAKRKLTVTTSSVAASTSTSNGRPVATTATVDGTTQITIPAAAGGTIRIERYDATGTQVAASQQQV